MRVVYIIAVGLAMSIDALAQSQNAVKTGVGSPLDALEVLQAEMKKYSDGQLGRSVKGAAGLAGIAAALSTASDGLNFRIRADGSIVSSGNNGGSSGGATDTSADTSSSSTN